MAEIGFQWVDPLCWLRRQGWHSIIHRQGRIKVHGPGQRWVKLKAITLTPGQTQVVGWMRLTDKKDAGWF
jgi:hypothetical protein